MSTNSSPAEQSNETKLPNQINILKILQSIFIPSAILSTSVQYITSKSASSFYGIDSELFHSQSFWLTIIDFLIPTLLNLAIFLTPLIVADYYKNSLKPIKERSNNKEKTLKFLYPLLFTIIFFYPLLSSCYILSQYADLFDSLKKGCAFIIICIVILLIVPVFLLKMYNKYQTGKDENWCLEKNFSICCFILCNLILWCQLFLIMGINILLLLILCSLFIIYFFATLYFFLDENKFFLNTWIIFTVLCLIPCICTIAPPLSSGKTYYSGKNNTK